MISNEFTFIEAFGNWEIVRTSDENGVVEYVVFWGGAQNSSSFHESLDDARKWCEENPE